MLYKIWNKSQYCTNFFVFYKKFNKKPSAYDASKMNRLFHENVVEKNKKLKTMKLATLTEAVSQNKSYICSTGENTRFVNIDIDANAFKLFRTMLRYYNQKFSKNELNDKSQPEMLFLRYFLPTFHYETNSSKGLHGTKVRLVYAFDRLISKNELTLIVEKLKGLIYGVFGAIVDNASKNIKQIFYGTIKRVFVNQNVRIYNAQKMIEVLNYVLNILAIEVKTSSILKSYESGISKVSNNLFETHDYDEALWMYVALYHLNLQHLIITKPKWIKKFEQTMKNRPYFRVKHNTKGYELLNKLLRKENVINGM
ncbi:hypothetical protein [Mycoplasma sp. HS2188]|uniref:hypothetical protein n=1 Tax=Mycoplasma sp. HS2188 TaxID=2976765 RepID=UPI0021AAA043|nr:hypothetical protein [Mycoplasma sp. HS2188]MCT4469968.1 hypothetical protein [Mycoplasma sp. HS2188]